MPTRDPKEIIQYLNEKKGNLYEDNESIDLAVENSPQELVPKSQTDSITDSIMGQLENSPLKQLGEDFIAEQVSKVGNQLLNNAQSLIGSQIDKITTATEQAVNLAFSSITAAITAQNNIVMFFIQQLAQQIIDRLDEKETIRLQMEQSLRELYNALSQLVAGDPFFEQYLQQLRLALQKLYAAQNETVSLRNTFVATDVFQTRRYDDILSLLKEAEQLLQPEGEQTDRPFTQEGLFANIGIPTDSQQLAIILAIPKLVKQTILATKGYLEITAQINGLLVAFISSIDTVSAVSSDKIKNYTVGMLDSIFERLSSLTSEMALQLNGSEGAYNTPISGFNPKPIPVSGNALGWLLQVKTIIGQLELIPKDALKNLNLDQGARSSFQRAVDQIKALTDQRRGDAILRVTEGQEQIGLMETQITQFCLASLGAIVSGSIASNILPLGRSVISYMDLSRQNDNLIRQALIPFIGTSLPSSDLLNKIGNGIFDMLDSMGLDKAGDLLRGGQFLDFFNLTTRTATYAGYALSVLSELKACVNETENVNVLERAEREIERDVQNSELLLQTASESALKTQKEENAAKIDALDRLRDDVKKTPTDCIVDDAGNFNGDALVERFGGVLGVNILGEAFGDSALQRTARSIGRLF